MQELFAQLFNKDFNDPGSRALMEDVTKKYPYFTAAQYFLLKKMSTDENGYDKAAAKTALQFGNTFMLNYQLKRDDMPASIHKTGSPGDAEKSSVDMQPEKPVKEEMLFELLFATDYFASQGIKLSEEVQPGDKLGSQLRSFTDWLKSMKKVHGDKGPSPNEQIDLAVQNLAEKSNLEDEILTESMAEAYLQQGKLKKARETLEKLSLLNPSKSAYFAAKLEKIPQE